MSPAEKLSKVRIADAFQVGADAELMRKSGNASGSRTGSDGHDERATPSTLGKRMRTGIVIDAQNVARLHRFWSSATLRVADGLHLLFMPTTHPETRPPTPLPTMAGA
ncbi:hypothetical protein ACIOEZ_07355 [Streptomyces sp. NPDC087866]|uniref:hypothetical protein n=1 Tax=unclassified Streptomyces TaxID=2593676 RepID=UPI0033ACE822